MRRLLVSLALFLAAAFALPAADGLAENVSRKLDSLEQRRVKRGSVVTFTTEEINAWARATIPAVVPEGMRDEQVELFNGSATGYALVNFLKMRQAKGQDTNWLISRLIEGERPLKIWVRLESGAGRCTVFLTRVELSDVAVNQTVLDFLIRTFLLPLYPDVKINQPFDLDYDIDRIDITPRAVVVTIKR